MRSRSSLQRQNFCASARDTTKGPWFCGTSFAFEISLRAEVSAGTNVELWDAGHGTSV
jgi:hypothetical protein